MLTENERAAIQLLMMGCTTTYLVNHAENWAAWGLSEAVDNELRTRAQVGEHPLTCKCPRCEN